MIFHNIMLLNQVNKYFCKHHGFLQFLRYKSKQPTIKQVLYPLESRGLLRITGNESSAFLQGLITNDMQHFDEGARTMYTMFLNNKGRVLFDTLIHKWGDDNSFMIECDKRVLNLLEKHLKIYKLRRNVSVEDVNTKFRVWALISNPPDETVNELSDIKNDIKVYRDPRLSELGCRLITDSTLNGQNIAANINNKIDVENSEDDYKYLRYRLGVSEGSDDLPPGVTFPLEVNCDYLHGVSFHKGCYIGQELTARVHHTGVVRKRIMPIRFKIQIDNKVEKDIVIKANNVAKSSLGKLKGVINDYGIGLVRIKESLEAKGLIIGNFTAEVVKPNWWPTEAPKELPKVDKELPEIDKELPKDDKEKPKNDNELSKADKEIKI